MSVFSEIKDAFFEMGQGIRKAFRKPEPKLSSENYYGDQTVVDISGRSYYGRNVSIKNNRVFVNGKEVTLDPNNKHVSIVINGDIEKLNCDNADTIRVFGAAGMVSTMSGDVQCEDVRGDVSTMSGDVTCGPVTGSVSTMSGRITHK